MTDICDEFQVQETAFRLKPLPPLEAARLWPKLAGVIAPAIQAMKLLDSAEPESDAGSDNGTRGLADILASVDVETMAKVVGGLTEVLSDLDPAIAQFKSVSQVDWHGVKRSDGSPTFIPLAGVFDAVFTRKPTLMLMWLVNCIKCEFGDFLPSTGQSQ